MEVLPSNGHAEPSNKFCKMNGDAEISLPNQKDTKRPFMQMTIAMIKERQSLGHSILLNGENLTVAQVYHVSTSSNIHVDVPNDCLKEVAKNSNYLQEKIDNGLVVYGVNTGFGGSADVRCKDTVAVQKSLVKHLNAGFGETFDPSVPRAVMLIRANSLCRAMSAVRPEVIKLLCDMIRENIKPIVPKRGSVSASGDLMPTSYIASAMMGRSKCQVLHGDDVKPADVALSSAGLTPITFINKEALSIINSASFASGLASQVLYGATSAALLTQIAVAMTTEGLVGRRESFHPTIHRCMPHPGQCEVADTIYALLEGSCMCIAELDMNRHDDERALKQDRYPLRTAAQWLGPAIELLERAVKTVEIDLNSSNDNPIIDHVNDTILHGGNFQGTAVAVAMDNTRQALQLCGKLMFAQMSEIVNVNLNNGLPPNLSGCDISSDFGFKGTDTAMASYMSELDMLTSPVTSHVLSAEMANQAVNSLALISARWSEQALTVLQQMLANILLCQTQAIDLRWLQGQVNQILKQFSSKYAISPEQLDHRMWPWYEFLFTAEKNATKLASSVLDEGKRASFVKELTEQMAEVNQKLKSGDCTDAVLQSLGKGPRKMYCFIRKELVIKFYDGEHYLDEDLRKIHSAIINRTIENVILEVLI